MTRTTSSTLRIGEPYFTVRELTEEERKAIETLSGIHPNHDPDEDDGGGSPPEAEEELLSVFIENAMQFACCEPFNDRSRTALADMASFAEYLFDAMSLMAKVNEAELEVLVLASIYAKQTVDTNVCKGGPSRASWEARVKEARALHDSCIRRAMGDN